MLFLTILIALLTYLSYRFFLKPLQYWKRRNIFFVAPFRRFFRVYFDDKSLAEHVRIAYESFPQHRYYGSYQFTRPSLFVRDVDLIKLITIKDFEYFPDHFGVVSEESDRMLGQNLVNLRGKKWRSMRSTLSPAFTSAKMRAMFGLIRETADNFTEYFVQNEHERTIEFKEAFSRYSNDVIANVVFGVSVNSISDKNNEFYLKAKELTDLKGWQALRGFLNALFPEVFKFYKIPFFPESRTEFFAKILKDNMEKRENSQVVRPDMIHLFLEAKKGRLNSDQAATKHEGYSAVDELVAEGDRLLLTDDLITAQALTFFFAGFETSSTLLSFAAHELALNPDIQTKLQKEIDQISTDKTVSYNELLSMKYLDQIVSETLRKYPNVFAMNRLCVKDYKVEAKLPHEKDFTLEKDCLIMIPVMGLHYDPEFFPEPYKFDPERFNEENRQRIVPGSYLPFGSGPRNCIGSRFGLLECKAMLVSLLKKFTLVPVEKTRNPLKFAKYVTLTSKTGFWLGLESRTLTQNSQEK